VSFDSIALPQRDAALAAWPFGAPSVIEQDAGHVATRWTTASGTVFELWAHEYAAENVILGGHCFPGGTDVGLSPFQFGCADKGTFAVGELVMQFFIAHPLG
jgi:hypothetical protein